MRLLSFKCFFRNSAALKLEILSHNDLNREAPPEKRAFLRLQVYKKAGISSIEVYKGVRKSEYRYSCQNLNWAKQYLFLGQHLFRLSLMFYRNSVHELHSKGLEERGTGLKLIDMWKEYFFQ